MSYAIDDDMCLSCGSCVGSCPVGAIVIEETAVIDEDMCNECGACLGVCPVDAIVFP